jgi:hypothetical protein
MVFMNAAGGNAWQPVGNTIVCASTTRPSVPFEGQRIYETDTNLSLFMMVRLGLKTLRVRLMPNAPPNALTYNSD